MTHEHPEQLPEQHPDRPGQQPSSGPQQASGQGSSRQQQAQGFFSALFDISFHTLITPKIVRVVYAASMVIGVLYFVFFLVAGFVQEPVLGLLVLVLGPIVLLIWLAFVRMTLEVYVAVVRIADDVHRSFGPDHPPRR